MTKTFGLFFDSVIKWLMECKILKTFWLVSAYFKTPNQNYLTCDYETLFGSTVGQYLLKKINLKFMWRRLLKQCSKMWRCFDSQWLWIDRLLYKHVFKAKLLKRCIGILSVRKCYF